MAAAGALAAGFQFTNLSRLPQCGHLLLPRSDQSPLRADARLRILDEIAYGGDEGCSALGPVSEPTWTGQVVTSVRVPNFNPLCSAAPMEVGWLVT